MRYLFFGGEQILHQKRTFLFGTRQDVFTSRLINRYLISNKIGLN